MEKSELRKILDILEEAGFTVTYYRFAKDHPDCCSTVSVKSANIADAYDHFEAETAESGAVCALLEKQKYQVRKCVLNKHIAAHYGGTFLLEIIPPAVKVT
jgi:hypothetical protein